MFDGSSIVDPVVVSSVFWSSLKARILSIIIGQLVATVVVSLLALLFSSQLVALSNYVSEQVFQSGFGIARMNYQDESIPNDINDCNSKRT